MAKEKEELNLEGTKVEKKKATKKKDAAKVTKIKEDKVSVTADSKNKKKVDEPTEKASAKAKANKKTTNKLSEKAVAKKETKASTIKKTSKSVATKTSSKTTNSPKEIKDNNVTPDTSKEKVKEETIIEKIKSFIAKIAAMQEEAKKESLETSEEQKSKKTSKKTDEAEEKTVYLPEYYDLPYRYNETVVKILAQTPKRIFVYWDVADEDVARYQNAFGNDFFEKTYPVLLVHNDDKNYTTEIPINDFANSWYIDIKDPKTKYTIQLGRKFREIPRNIDATKIAENNIVLKTDYLPIAQSNRLEVPNDHILFDSMPSKITFRNVKTYKEKQKVITGMKTPYSTLYNVKRFYKENYENEIDNEVFDLNNPTSGGLSSSSFK